MADQAQAPDPQPGFYYVDVVRGDRVGLLVGPFRAHADALTWVDPARRLAQELDPWAWFDSFGTLRAANGNRAGVLNDRLRIPKELLTNG